MAYLAQNLIPCSVTVLVVDWFKAIQVDKHHSEGARVPQI